MTSRKLKSGEFGIGLERNVLSLDPIKESGRRAWMEELEQKGIKFGNEEFTQKLLEKIENENNFLGYGGAGVVFDVGNQCVKIIRNRWKKGVIKSKYNLGRNPLDEFRIQNATNDLEVDGVRAPKVFRCDFSDQNDFAAIFMERLDAIELNDILRGFVPMPENFDVDDFLTGLGGYIDELHEMQIIHADLAPRNVMVDKDTGKARVIDFGRAQMYGSAHPNFEKIAKVDYDGYEQIEEAVLNFVK